MIFSENVIVNAMLQQARRAQRQLRAILSRDSTGKTYLSELVEGFLADLSQDTGYFAQAENDFKELCTPVESARETLRNVVGIDKNFEYVDAVCRSMVRYQNYCSELWVIAATDGRDGIATAYKSGRLFFQQFRS
jgi:hypothetical protein